ncbi:MAG: hypothetical protein DRJ31_05935 [Candidatus Methanomethylicota archaeon]|uniref:Uncharacterized protein n=1 Tax=Thermoproteota archaeon TaxID=2056631 RepID=A0A497EPG9_9CREN|nr:MAG: hypothetical protein DRJ31_05935 [Candidatus Verstraetearchaeota archaeon]
MQELLGLEGVNDGPSFIYASSNLRCSCCSTIAL